MSLMVASANAQVAAPPDVVKSAIASVEALGKKVVMGEHKAAIESMYPQWKERMAKRKGGLDKLEQELEGIGAMMAREGVQIIDFKTKGAPSVYEVSPGAAAEVDEVQDDFKRWLILIPTVTQFRIMLDDSPKGHVINSYGFQVAIADKGKNNWTFINGSDVSVADLRFFFTNLPANMKLPPVKREAAD